MQALGLLTKSWPTPYLSISTRSQWLPKRKWGTSNFTKRNAVLWQTLSLHRFKNFFSVQVAPPETLHQVQISQQDQGDLQRSSRPQQLQEQTQGGLWTNGCPRKAVGIGWGQTRAFRVLRKGGWLGIARKWDATESSNNACLPNAATIFRVQHCNATWNDAKCPMDEHEWVYLAFPE